ncbi:MAG: hypothetical protein RLZZ585_293 [Bacteroidota bacterium]
MPNLRRNSKTKGQFPILTQRTGKACVRKQRHNHLGTTFEIQQKGSLEISWNGQKFDS